MPYKLFLLGFFLIAFIAPPSYAAIPIAQDEVVTVVQKKNPERPRKRSKKRVPNINGLLSFIFGITGIALFPLFAIPAIILGIISLTNKEPRQWMAITGIVIGGITFIVSIVVLAFLIAILF